VLAAVLAASASLAVFLSHHMSLAQALAIVAAVDCFATLLLALFIRSGGGMGRIDSEGFFQRRLGGSVGGGAAASNAALRGNVEGNALVAMLESTLRKVLLSAGQQPQDQGVSRQPD